uniref:Xyloside xylosyltransferase 1 n=1 Tax=Gopherus agassizii TaxID=38772 RepID=A0A452HZX2_9SAUR
MQGLRQPIWVRNATGFSCSQALISCLRERPPEIRTVLQAVGLILLASVVLGSHLVAAGAICPMVCKPPVLCSSPFSRHTFWQFRRENPQTKVGEPPPDGLPGFNSGVMLLNLEAMRQSQLYNQLLEPDMVRQLTEKYHFKGHLGDQDFFTMIGMEHPELFHVLHCTWNRQLCSWWREHGYSDVFDQYFRCEGQVRIYHGNCNTPIPED